MNAVALRNPLAETLAAGRLALSLIVQKVGSADIALAAAACGFDAVTVDLEHSVLGEAVAAQICIAAQLAGVTPLVRVPTHDAATIGRMLDAGAMGIVAPHVESADEARALVAACRFPPQGKRSVSYHWPQFAYRPLEPGAMRRALDAATTLVAMIESPEAAEQAEAIAAVPGVDIVHVGSLDLADALGVPGRVDDPRVAAIHDRVIAACRRHGKTAGIGAVAGQPALARRVLAQGARFLTAGVDWDFLLAAARSRASALREMEN